MDCGVNKVVSARKLSRRGNKIENWLTNGRNVGCPGEVLVFSHFIVNK